MEEKTDVEAQTQESSSALFFNANRPVTLKVIYMYNTIL